MRIAATMTTTTKSFSLSLSPCLPTSIVAATTTNRIHKRISFFMIRGFYDDDDDVVVMMFGKYSVLLPVAIHPDS